MQELAGIDVISNGELPRFDINHPETNGMIDYFVWPMNGISWELSQSELDLFRERLGSHFRTQPDPPVARADRCPFRIDYAHELTATVQNVVEIEGAHRKVRTLLEV